MFVNIYLLTTVVILHLFFYYYKYLLSPYLLSKIKAFDIKALIGIIN